MRRQLLFLLFLGLMASSAYGEVYTWTDSRGTVHYTNSLYEVPARYRAAVKVLDLGPEPKADGTTSTRAVPPPSQPAMPAAVEQRKQGPVQTRTRPVRRRAVEADE